MRKQLYYLADHGLVAYLLEKGRLAQTGRFDCTHEGRLAFAHYLDSVSEVPAWLLVDVVEEDFQRDTVPHVAGRARTALIERRLLQLYRDTPYRHAAPQGRERDGRKDDRLLFSALTKPDHLTPWLETLQQRAVPLAGIYSVALLGELFARKTRLPAERCLLITRQSAGLRQSYLEEGHLRFSRLTPLSDSDPQAVAATVLREAEKTRQFLASTRQLPRDQSVVAVVVTDAASADVLRASAMDHLSMSYHVQGVDDVADLLRQASSGAGECDALFLRLLGAAAPRPHYSFAPPMRLYRLWHARRAMYAASAVLAIAAGVSGVSNLFAAYDANQAAQLAENETRVAQAQNRSALNTRPVTVREPAEMKAAVEIHRMVATQGPRLDPMMLAVSSALESAPAVRLAQMGWEVRIEDPATATVGATPPPGVELPPAGNLIGVPGRPYELLYLEGEVDVAPEEMRAALDSVNAFVHALRSRRGLRVDLVRTPMDLSTATHLRGRAGDDGTPVPPSFAVRVIRGLDE